MSLVKFEVTPLEEGFHLSAAFDDGSGKVVNKNYAAETKHSLMRVVAKVVGLTEFRSVIRPARGRPPKKRPEGIGP